MSYNVDYQSGGTETSPSIPGKTSIVLPQSVVNNTSTSLTLTGKGVPNYGEIQQENFIRLLEHFASKNAPLNPTIGQVWYDTTVSSLKVFGMDSAWHKIGGVTSSASQPTGPSTGDLWYDSSTSTLKVWNGTAWVGIGGGSNAGSSAPSSPTTGQLWYDTTTDTLKVWNGSAWVAVGAGSGVAAGGSPPSPAVEGMLWYNTTDRILYVKVNTSTVAADIALYYTDWAQVWPSITRYASYTEYNSLAARINRVIGAPSVFGANADVADNQYGWGQTDTLEVFSTINAPSPFDNTKWITLASRLRKALRHTTTDETTVPTAGFIMDGRGPNTTASTYTPAVTWLAGWQGRGIHTLTTDFANLSAAVTALETNRFATNPASMQVTAVRTDSTVGTTWASTRILNVNVQFASDAAAKAFFNAGGAARFTMSLASGSGVGFEWYQLVNNNGLNSGGFVMDHKGSKIGFSGTYGANGTTAIGFYDLTTSYQTVASYTRGGAYGTGGLVIEAMYNPATALLYFRLNFNEDFAAGQSINKLTVATDLRASVASITGTPYLDTPAIVLPTVSASGTLQVAAAGT